MLKVLTIIAVLLAIGVAAILAYAATRPDDFRVARTQSIQAPPDKIFPLITDLHQFNRWNPFAKQDPDLKIVYSGPESGPGAAQGWESRKSGKGRLKITDVAPPSKVAMNLDILKPTEGHNKVLFTLAPNGAATDVTWSMTGKTPFVGKMMSLFVSMDRIIGGEFAKGLADLKALAEGGAAAPAGQS
jgi:uncharacterized protein YndB with AHSA1/START domain